MSKNKNLYDEKFRLFYERSPLGYQSLNEEGCLLEVNPAWLDLLGYSHDEVIGKCFGDFLTPGDQKLFTKRFPGFKSAGETRGVFFDMVHKDGHVVSVEIDGMIEYDKEGHFQQTHCVLHDITERKQMEQQTALNVRILEIINRSVEWKKSIEGVLSEIKKFIDFDAVAIRFREGEDFPYYVTQGFPEHFVEAERYLCTRDGKGEIERDSNGNPYVECMCGNIICGRTDASKYFFTKGGSFWSNNTSKLLAETTEEDRQARTRNRCNSEGYESVALIPLKAGYEILGLIQLNDMKTNQFTEHLICFFEQLAKDIGIAFAHRKVEAALQKAHDELEKRVVERTAELIAAQEQIIRSERLAATGQLAASVAHEINSPLQAISILLGTMRRENEENKELLDNIVLLKGAFYNIRDTVKNLMDLNRSGKERKQMINVNAIIISTVALMKSHIKKNKVKINLNLSQTIPDLIASPQQLSHVFLNLINNAVEAMSGSTKSEDKWKERTKIGGDISIKTMLKKDKVVIQVSDTGPGIAEEDLEHIFDPFYTRKKTMGTGVGLSICNGIIEDHDGDIEAKNAKDGGAVFTIILPVKKD